MAYFGVQPSSVFTGSGAKNVFNGDASTTAFTMSQAVLETTNIEVFVGNVRQEPSVAYTVSGFTLTFTGTPASGTGNIYVVHQNSNSDTVAVTPGLALAPSTLAVTGTSTLTGNVTAAGTLGVTGATTLTGATTAAAITASGLVTANANMLLAGTAPTLTIGDAGTEDAKIVFDGNAQDFHIGLDDSADDLVIGKGSALGTTPAISINEDLVSTFGATAIGKLFTDTTNTGDITLNFTTHQNFLLTFTGNVELQNPTTENVGQSGFIIIIQDGTGSRTLSFEGDFETAAAAGIVLSTAANSVDVIPYVVAASNRILLGAVQLAFS